MNQLRKAHRVLAVMVTVIVILSSLQTNVIAQANLDPILVLYDASHSQQYAADDETLGLKLMLDAVNTSTRYMVKVNEDAELTDSVLNDVDILIIAAPHTSSPFSDDETHGIKEMLANGSSLFLLGDPVIDQTTTYWSEALMRDLGENNAINSLLDSINVTGVRFSVNRTVLENIYADTMFDYEHPIFNETYPYMIQLDPSTWETDHPIFRNINTLYTLTATLKPIGLSSGLASGYETSFAQFRRGPNTWANYSFPNTTLEEFEEKPLSYSAINGTFPSWMSAFEYDESRITIVGSTLMFTGRVLAYPSTDQRWFYMGDNSRLFLNIINWLSQDSVEAPSAILPMLIISSVIMAVGVSFYILKKIR